MTREELSQIYYINKEIVMWEKELEHIREASLMKSKEITDMPFANTNETGDPVAELAMKMLDIEMIIVGKKKELEYKRMEILKFINDVDDSMLRMIIKYRCIDCLSWNNVAAKIGGGNTEDSCRMQFNRMFKKD